MYTNSCATCANIYSDPTLSASEKPLFRGRDLPCCGRSICARCLNQNKRYETYCPYCQITTEPSILPQGLKDPPPYSSLGEAHDSAAYLPAADEDEDEDEQPPAYSNHHTSRNPTPSEKHESAPDVLHFVTPNDSVRSLALAYGVPIDALRRSNSLFSDNLLQGRRTIMIPGEYYKSGISLSPRPVEGEEEEARKQKVRRWMVACKVAEYDVALLYLKQSDWHLETAIQTYRDDELWEAEHPLQAKQKGKSAKDVGMRRFVGSRR